MGMILKNDSSIGIAYRINNQEYGVALTASFGIDEFINEQEFIRNALSIFLLALWDLKNREHRTKADGYGKFIAKVKEELILIDQHAND